MCLHSPIALFKLPVKTQESVTSPIGPGANPLIAPIRSLQRAACAAYELRRDWIAPEARS
jgi:hypothetical protein